MANDLASLALATRATSDRMTRTYGASSDIAHHWQLRSAMITRRYRRTLTKGN